MMITIQMHFILQVDGDRRISLHPFAWSDCKWKAYDYKRKYKIKEQKRRQHLWEQWKVRQSLVLNQKKKGIIQFLFIIFLYIIQKLE